MPPYDFESSPPETLDKAERKFRDLLETAPDAILIVNHKGEVVRLNMQAEKLFGYARNEFLGRKIESLVPERFGHHAQYRIQYLATPMVRPMGTDLALFARRKDGSEFPVEVSLSSLETEDGTLISCAIRDITERKRLEDALREVSRQKDVLLEEMQHRVANSLQIIANILMLKVRSAASEEARQDLLEARQRVLSVAEVQEHLHHAGNGDTVLVKPYLSQLCYCLAASMISDSRPVALTVNADEGEVSSRSATSLGLIVTELVINSLKYAFPDERSAGEVLVRYAVQDRGWHLSVSDNGIGHGEPARATADKGGLGTRLVKALAEQLEADVEIVSGSTGTRVSIIHAPH